jgi:hypothetical protein
VSAKIIAYECVAPSHEPNAAYPDKLTINEGGWAFCPFDARADGHDWHATGGEDLATLLRRRGHASLPNAR